MPQEKYN